MKKIILLVQRNLSLFRKSKLLIMLSIASVFTVLGIYLMFLRDFLMDTVAQSGVPSHMAAMFTDRFMMAGLLVVISTTTCFGLLQICVNDAATGIRRDFLAAPVSKFQMYLGYLIAAAAESSLITSATAVACLFALSGKYEFSLSVPMALQILCTVVAASLMNAAILLCLFLDLKSIAAFSTIANLYGTLIGFLAETYLPCYFYPGWLREILFWFPPTQFNSMLRQAFVRGISLPVEEKSVLYQDFGIWLTRGGSVCELSRQWCIAGVMFVALLAYLWLRCVEARPRPQLLHAGYRRRK